MSIVITTRDGLLVGLFDSVEIAVARLTDYATENELEPIFGVDNHACDIGDDTFYLNRIHEVNTILI